MIDWNKYALEYDIMAQNNPEYLKLIKKFKESFNLFNLKEGSRVAELGIGTGNFSYELIKSYPNIKFYGIDYSDEMIRRTKSKLATLKNDYCIIKADITKQILKENVFDVIYMIHTLYTLPNPQEVIRYVYLSLKSNGIFFLLDIGREINVTKWAKYLIKESIKKNGLFNTLLLLLKTSNVRKANKDIAKNQRTKKYFTHTLKDLEKMVLQEGFKILESSDKYYLCIDDLIIAQK